MWVATGILTILCGFLLLRQYTLERSLRAGTTQLRKRKTERTSGPLRLAAPNTAVESLLSEVNDLLREKEDERAAFQQREKTLREQIANVSHDLRTPLTSILGYLQLARESDTTEEQRQSYLDIVEGRAKVLQGLITSFYDLSRLEAGEYPIVRERVDIREVLCELLAAFYADLDAHFQVTVDLPDDLSPVWGDRAALSRVYTNLLRNALEHGSSTLHISACRSGKQVITKISNGGADLREEDLPHVFDRFFTSDQTRSGCNTGLGLAIVRALTEQMKGDAQAELAKGEFSVILTWAAFR